MTAKALPHAFLGWPARWVALVLAARIFGIAGAQAGELSPHDLALLDRLTWGVNASQARSLARTLVRERDRALLFRELATLRSDLPLFDSVDALRWRGPLASFAELGARLDAAVSR